MTALVRSVVYRLEIATSFSAAHAITMAGVMEPLHGHDWHVTVAVEGATLDADGLLVDFHWLQQQVAEVIGPYVNRNLNEASPFSGGVNPSAENVARHLAESLSDRLETWSGNLPKDDLTHPQRGLRIASVRVTEAVGCAATYVPMR